MTAPPRVSDLTPLISRSVPFLLHCAAFHSTRCVADALEPTGIEPRHFGLLCTLRSSGPQSQGWLGERLGIDRTTMVQLVDELERRGLVERKRNPHDRRSYQVTLTAEGEQTWARAKELAEGSEDEVLASLDEEERDTLRDLLARVVLAHDQPSCST
jgi:DNA-binding MarR family transcriptional regulator